MFACKSLLFCEDAPELTEGLDDVIRYSPLLWIIPVSLRDHLELHILYFMDIKFGCALWLEL